MLAGRQLHQREDGRWVARVPGLAEEVFPACIGRVKCVWSVKFGHGFLIFPELSRWLTSPEECMSTIARRGRPRPGAKKIESLEDNPEPAPTRTNGNHKAHGGIEVFSGPKRAKTETPQKIIATRWKAVGDDVPAGYRDRWLYVAEIAGDGTGRDPTMERAAGDYPAVSPLWGIFADNPEWHSRRRIHEKMERMLTFHFPAGWPSFEAAQIALNGYAWEKRWTPDPPLPVDDDEPKPVRANGNHEGHNEAAKTQDPRPKTEAEGSPLVHVKIDLVDPNPFQPRRQFDEGETAALAESIRAEGLLHPPVARHHPGHAYRYELALGERRLRACKLLGWKTIPLRILVLDDADMRRKAAAENAQRKDLDPIERAREWKSLLEAGDYPSQDALAKALGVGQGTVSQAIGLLELPAECQERIISREISPKHAGHLLPYRHQPKLLAAIFKRLGAAPCEENEDEFRDHVRRIALHAGEPMTGEIWSDRPDGNWYVPVFRPTKEEEAELEIVEVKDFEGKQQRLALNKKLWASLQKTHETAWLKKRDAHGRAKKGTAADGPRNKKLSAAEEAAAAKERAERLRKRVQNFRTDWLRYLVAQAVPTLDPKSTWLLRILLYAPINSPAHDMAKHNCLAESLRAAGGDVRMSGHGRPKTWPGLAALSAEKLAGVGVAYVAGFFWRAGKQAGPAESMLSADDVEAIAASLGLDLEKAWRREQAGPLTARWWSLFTKEDLIEKGTDLGIHLDAGKPKRVMVKLLSAVKGCPLPKEIKKLRKAA